MTWAALPSQWSCAPSVRSLAASTSTEPNRSGDNSTQKPAEEEVFRKQQQQPERQRQWGLPPPPTANFSRWSGSAEDDGARRWQPTEPPPASWPEVRPALSACMRSLACSGCC